MDVTIERATAPTDDVRALVEELEATLAAGYPAEQRHGLSLDALFTPHVRFFLAHLAGTPVGCAGVALLPDLAELKRMYVRPAARGRGVADALLARIATETLAANLTRLCLETGDQQHAAIRLYTRAGFSPCAPFGPYAAMPPSRIATSRFFEKYLRP